MDEITVYSNRDLRTLERGTDLDTLDSPESELNESYEYLLNRKKFSAAYKSWNRDEDPILQVEDELTHLPIYLGHPSAQRINDAIEKKQADVQIF